MALIPRGRMVASRYGMEKSTWEPATAVSSRLMRRQRSRFGKQRCASRYKPGITGHRTLPKGKFSWGLTAPTTACAGLLSRTTRRPERKCGVSGRCRVILRSRSNQKRWKKPRGPGTARAGGGLAAAMCGTRLLMTTQPDWSSSAQRASGSTMAKCPRSRLPRAAVWRMHHCSRRGHGRIRVALPDRGGRSALREQSHCDGGFGHKRREAPCGDDRSKEWILLYPGCKDGKASIGEATGQDNVGEFDQPRHRQASFDSSFRGWWEAVDGPQLVADEL